MIKYEDLKCEHCNGAGEKEKFVEPYGDSPVTCTFCNGSGIDEDQLMKSFIEYFSVSQPCANCGCSIETHREPDYYYQGRLCPEFFNGEFRGFRDTTFIIMKP